MNLITNRRFSISHGILISCDYGYKANVNGIHVSGQDFPSLAGGRAVVIIHYPICIAAS